MVTDLISSWWVYIVRCKDGSLYAGCAVDPVARAVRHNEGTGAKYTRSRLPVVLVYTEACLDRSTALKREAAIKQLDRPQKLKLIEFYQSKRPRLA